MFAGAQTQPSCRTHDWHAAIFRSFACPNVITDPALPQAYFDEPAGAVYLWVRTAAGLPMGAMLRTRVLHFRFGAALSGDDALKTYQNNRPEIEAAVLRRIANGSLEPVLRCAKPTSARAEPR